MLGTSADATVRRRPTKTAISENCTSVRSAHRNKVHELAPRVRLLRLLPLATSVLPKLNAPIERTQRIGQLALRAGAGNAQARQAVIAARLYSRSDWPIKPLAVVAIDVLTGETRIFDRHSGVALADAVAASCAVPHRRRRWAGTR